MRSISRCLNSRSRASAAPKSDAASSGLSHRFDLIAQTLFAPGELERLRLQHAEPIRPRHEQIARAPGNR